MTARHPLRRGVGALVAVLLLVLSLAACDGGEAADDESAGEDDPTATDGEGGDGGEQAGGPLTVYSGRNEELVGPLLDRFSEETGVELEVRYGDTAELAATILEEGDNSPADVYIAQDAGALGALREADALELLPEELLDRVEERFRDPEGTWIGLSGRARTLVHNTEALSADEVPDSVLDLTGDAWEGRVGWAPTNGSFQAFVTAMRVELGDEATREWVEEMIANGVRSYENNTAIVEAAARGEVDLGLVNHYYLYRFLAEDPDYPADNVFLEGGDVGALVNVAGAGVLATSDAAAQAQELIGFLLEEPSQRYFAEETFEYPLARGVDADDRLPALEDLETPELDLSDLEDLQGTLELLRSAGALT